MKKIRGGTAALALLLTFVFAASAQAVTTNFTTSNVTSPADGSLLFQNLDTNPNATITVSGTTNWTKSDTSNLFDIGCYSGTNDYHDYEGTAISGSGPGLALSPDGSFSATVPYSFFKSGTCNLVAVPHGTSTSVLPAGDTGARVTFSYFQTYQTSTGGPTYDYTFDDVTLSASAEAASIDDCGPFTDLVDGTSAMNVGPDLFYCAGSFYNSAADFSNAGTEDLSRSEIQVDGQNAYGSASADALFTGSSALPGFPALTASVDSFDTSTRDAQTTESEPLVKCTPDDAYSPTSSECTAFASTGVGIKRVTDYTDGGRVSTVTDTFTSTDGQAHSLDLQYETDLNSTSAGWELPGQTSFSQESTGATGPAPSSAPDTVYAIDNTAQPPSLVNPVGAMTFSTPYSSVSFDNTLWPSYAESSALFDYQEMVPAGGSTSITWSYATGTSLAEVQGYAAAAQAQMLDVSQAPTIAISSPASGATETSSPVTVSGTASAGSGVKSVTVNGVSATVSGGSWSASVPLTSGQNTLTATLTSDAGNTATAAETVTYAPPTTSVPPAKPVPAPHISVLSKRFNGKAVLVKLACRASGSNCAGKITLRYTETVVRRHKKHRVTVVIASKRYSLAAGHTATSKVGLNAVGRRLLKVHRKLGAKGTVTVTESGGRSQTAAHFGLTLKQPKQHHK
jgi:hypothetical protein